MSAPGADGGATLWAVLAKELRELSRDRRATVTMVLVPLLTAPLILGLVAAMAKSSNERIESRPVRIAVAGAEHADPRLRAWLEGTGDGAGSVFLLGMSLWRSKDRAADLQIRLSAGTLEERELDRALSILPWPQADPRVAQAAALYSTAALAEQDRVIRGEWRLAFQDFRRRVAEAIVDDRLDAALVLLPGFAADLDRGHGAGAVVLFDEARDHSRRAAERLEAVLQAGGTAITHEIVERHNLPPAVLRPVILERLNLGHKQALLAYLLPYFIVVLGFLGATHPAIDLIAGEKERGTLEPLLLLPGQRSAVLGGKFLAVAACALLASALATCGLLLARLTEPGALGAPGSLRVGTEVLLPTVLTLVPLSALFAALLLVISTFARGVREAQSYTVPLNLVIMLPALLPMLPGFALEGTLLFTPLLNIGLLLKEIWTGTWTPEVLLLVWLSNAAAAAALFLLAARLFGGERVLQRA